MIKKWLTASLLLGFFSTTSFSQNTITAIDDEFCVEDVSYGINDVYNLYENDLGSKYWYSGGIVNATALGDGWFESGGVRLFARQSDAGPFKVTGNYCISNGTESCANFVINVGGNCGPRSDNPDDDDPVDNPIDDPSDDPSDNPDDGNPDDGPDTTNAREIWVAQGQSNIQGSPLLSGPSQGFTLPKNIAMEFRVSGGLIPYNEQQGIGEWLIPGFQGYPQAKSQHHSVYYEFAKTYHELTGTQVIATPIYKGATAFSQYGSASYGGDYWLDDSWDGWAAGVEKVRLARESSPGAEVNVLWYAGEYEMFYLDPLKGGDVSSRKQNIKNDARTHINRMTNDLNADMVYAANMHYLANTDRWVQAGDLLAEILQELDAEMPKFEVVYDTRINLANDQYHVPGDYIHLGPQGLDELGKRMAEAIAN